jgi:hypothetical protein
MAFIKADLDKIRIWLHFVAPTKREDWVSDALPILD